MVPETAVKVIAGIVLAGWVPNDWMTQIDAPLLELKIARNLNDAQYNRVRSVASTFVFTSICRGDTRRLHQGADGVFSAVGIAKPNDTVGSATLEAIGIIVAASLGNTEADYCDHLLGIANSRNK